MRRTKADILAYYRQLADQQQSTAQKLQRSLNRISLARLGSFIAEIIIVATMINLGFSWIFVILLLVPVVGFLVLVKMQVRKTEAKLYADKLLWVYQNEIKALETHANGYPDGSVFDDESHSYASDLDIYGPGSLYAMVNRCNTSQGLSLLGQSLGAPAPAVYILQRQEAIRELRERINETFQFRALLHQHDGVKMQQIQEKLGHQLAGQLTFTRAGWMRPYVLLMPYVMFALLIAALWQGGLYWNVFGLTAVVNAVVTVSQIGRVNRLYLGFGQSAGLLEHFADTIRWTEKFHWQSGYIRSFYSEQHSSELSADIRRLGAIIRDFDARLNFLLAPFLSLFLIWDLRCSLRLARWYESSADDLLRGLDRVGQFEELTSFATLSFNQPDWNFPDIKPSFSLSATQLGHPLIPETLRVTNTYAFAPLPTTDIITGSNMAGKSTFLRTVGVNLVLAYTGAPVCAANMSCSIFQILSYMRIKDSLNDQTSTFKAELNRLKVILKATSESSDSLVLVDEMLRGTNSRDKYMGSKVFIEKLLSQQTPTLFATHDLQLSEMEDSHPDKVRNYHFDIQIHDGQMQFDYLLKQGPCTTFNAAILLKEIGLSIK
ncbi:MutS-related protein [Pedobacter deserti]|uniref:MutS-related protein n=1 Tax=Pedobacter deserti TaxID=2817382 RepID=UPI00210AAB5F|nr:DNA mismatch repair protein MutS [Pedobacter sp. SYSU D00382]